MTKNEKEFEKEWNKISKKYYSKEDKIMQEWQEAIKKAKTSEQRQRVNVQYRKEYSEAEKQTDLAYKNTWNKYFKIKIK